MSTKRLKPSPADLGMSCMKNPSSMDQNRAGGHGDPEHCYHCLHTFHIKTKLGFAIAKILNCKVDNSDNGNLPIVLPYKTKWNTETLGELPYNEMIDELWSGHEQGDLTRGGDLGGTVPQISMFLHSRASDNTTCTSQNIGGTDALAAPPPQTLWGTVPSSPPRSPPLAIGPCQIGKPEPDATHVT